MKHSPFNAMISALDAEISALDVETSALDVETSAHGADVWRYRCRRGDIGARAEFPAISAIAVLV